MANAKENRTPDGVEQTEKKRSWRFWLAIGALSVVVVIGVAAGAVQLRNALIGNLGGFIAVALTDAQAPPSTTTTEPVTTVTESSTTTTTVPAPTTTTTIPEVTTTVFLPIVDRETLGFLAEGDGEEMRVERAYSVFLSGVVISVNEEKVAHPVEGTLVDAYVLYVDLGDYQDTDEAIIGRLYVAAKDHPTWGGMGYCAGGTNCSNAYGEEILSLLVQGRQYDFYVVTEFYCNEYPENQRELCLGANDPLEPFLGYNSAIVSALKEGDSLDSTGLGLMDVIEIPLGVAIP